MSGSLVLVSILFEVLLFFEASTPYPIPFKAPLLTNYEDGRRSEGLLFATAPVVGVGILKLVMGAGCTLELI